MDRCVVAEVAFLAARRKHVCKSKRVVRIIMEYYISSQVYFLSIRKKTGLGAYASTYVIFGCKIQW